MRSVTYITGTRADFGLMERTLLAIQAHPRLKLSLIVTGMHLDPVFGSTVAVIRKAGLAIAKEVPTPLTPASGARMARNFGLMVPAFVDELERTSPDLVLLLGDRGEMLAGAVAAIHLNIPVVHIHGGERSGTVDESIRHAISKLSHLHFTATAKSRERLIRMGEAPDRVYVTGAPGLDSLVETSRGTKAELMSLHGLDPEQPLALFAYHPVLQEAAATSGDTATILKALKERGCAVLAVAPNADAGSDGVRSTLYAEPQTSRFRLCAHLDRPEFIAAMAGADVMIGNSSAGIIEAASFGTPVLNVGSRQNLRERNRNVIDILAEPIALRSHIAAVLSKPRFAPENVYGDGRSAQRIADLLATVTLDESLLSKVNQY